MSLPTIWVVQGSTGEYSDHDEWIVGWYETEAEAQDAVTALTRAVNTLIATSRKRGDYERRRDAAERARELGIDSSLMIDYTGFNYTAIEVGPGMAAGEIANRTGVTAKETDA